MDVKSLLVLKPLCIPPGLFPLPHGSLLVLTGSSLSFHRIGRRPVFLICILIQGLFGLGIAFVPHFYVFMAFRFVVGAAVSGIMIAVVSLGEWEALALRQQMWPHKTQEQKRAQNKA